MDTHELVPMTRRRYRSLVSAAEDAARTGRGPTPADLPVVPASVLSALPAQRARRRSSIRRTTVGTTA